MQNKLVNRLTTGVSVRSDTFVMQNVQIAAIPCAHVCNGWASGRRHQHWRAHRQPLPSSDEGSRGFDGAAPGLFAFFFSCPNADVNCGPNTSFYSCLLGKEGRGKIPSKETKGLDLLVCVKPIGIAEESSFPAKFREWSTELTVHLRVQGRVCK